MHVSRKSKSAPHKNYLLPPPLAIEALREGATHVICASGELDLSDCPKLEHALLEAESSKTERILLDIDGLTFIDVAGLQTLVAAGLRSQRNGAHLQMTPGTGSVAEIFRLTSLDSTLPIVSLDEPRLHLAATAAADAG